MLLMPKKIVHQKVHLSPLKHMSYSNRHFIFGNFALRANARAVWTAQQIDGVRRRLIKTLKKKRGENIFMRIFPDQPITKKSKGARMGGGKGSIVRWISKIRPNVILYELQGAPDALALETLAQVSYKLPFQSQIIATKWIHIHE